MGTISIPAAISLVMVTVFATPAPAQVRLFTDGQIVKFGPTKAERRARQMGVMLGAMSGRHPPPQQPLRLNGAGGSQSAPDQDATAGR